MKARRCLVVIAIVPLIATGIVSVIGKSNTKVQALFAIEKLHQQDIAATLSGDPNKLAELWADDAVGSLNLKFLPCDVDLVRVVRRSVENYQI